MYVSFGYIYVSFLTCAKCIHLQCVCVCQHTLIDTHKARRSACVSTRLCVNAHSSTHTNKLKCVSCLDRSLLASLSGRDRSLLASLSGFGFLSSIYAFLCAIWRAYAGVCVVLEGHILLKCTHTYITQLHAYNTPCGRMWCCGWCRKEHKLLNCTYTVHSDVGACVVSKVVYITHLHARNA